MLTGALNPAALTPHCASDELQAEEKPETEGVEAGVNEGQLTTTEIAGIATRRFRVGETGQWTGLHASVLPWAL